MPFLAASFDSPSLHLCLRFVKRCRVKRRIGSVRILWSVTLTIVFFPRDNQWTRIRRTVSHGTARPDIHKHARGTSINSSFGASEWWTAEEGAGKSQDMQSGVLPFTHDVVLIGGGHTHALVLRKWGMAPLAGARLTVVNPGPTALYSGMLPGFIAGHYSRDELTIDLVRLARFAGARFIDGKVERMDPVAREVHVSGRPPIGFDLASLDVGITSLMPSMPGFSGYGVPVKPLAGFANAWKGFLTERRSGSVVLIGAGVAGAELAIAMAYSMRSHGREDSVTLVDRSLAVAMLGGAARRGMLATLRRNGISLVENAEIQEITQEGIRLSDGREIKAGFVAGAAGARPYRWLESSGLELHHGFVAVNDMLQTSNPTVFAAGDCAHLAFGPRPKAGVFAVRQAPILYNNLRAELTGEAKRRYRPQKDYLKLISLGDRRALAERFGMAFSGSLMWRWKNRIDRRFMARLNRLPAMPRRKESRHRTAAFDAALGSRPMCGGCGAKVGRGALRDVLKALPASVRDDVNALPGDDAALLFTGCTRQVLTTDHLRAFFSDAAQMARIAAVHALGDIWAMGAQPQAATVTLVLERQTPELQARQLREIVETAHEVMREAGAEIVGGHSSLGDELTIGFSVTGLCREDPITLSGAQPNDRLILTKPLGSGTILAADMALEARGEDVLAALSLMSVPQGAASRILSGAHAMTDVTGFGLAGHLKGICEASGMGARLVLESVPLIPGAAELSARGVRSTLFDDNVAAVPELGGVPGTDLLFDPQTSGGLLAAVAPEQSDAIIRQLRNAGYPAACIGFLVEGGSVIRLANG